MTHARDERLPDKENAYHRMMNGKGGSPPWRAPTILRVRWQNEHGVVLWAEIRTNRKHKKFWYSEGYENDPGRNCNRDATTSVRILHRWCEGMAAMTAAYPAPERTP